MTTFQFIVLAFVIGLPTMLLQMYWRHRDKERARRSPLWLTWSALQAELSQTLHHPHPESAEMDKLLEKLDTFTAAGVSQISDEDRKRLTQLLREKVDDPKQEKSERTRAEYLLLSMRRVGQEQIKS